ncbi:MAG: hypothetical protein EPO40_03145 [Myxococcaceae bacterium]|nr:MAG: hypothetical protein EPO40_03145 [Myxococcaceae bacterium]
MNPVDATILGLIAAWDGAPELAFTVDGKPDQLSVNDGPRLDDPEAWRVLVVGATAGFVPVGQATTRPGYGGRREEQFEVRCELTVWDGDTDLAHVRTQAYAVLDVLAELLAAHEWGDDISWARITRHSYQPAQSDLGVGVLIPFSVVANATRFEGA